MCKGVKQKSCTIFCPTLRPTLTRTEWVIKLGPNWATCQTSDDHLPRPAFRFWFCGLPPITRGGGKICQKKLPVGFTGDGTFALRLWTEKPKMKKEDWVQYIPQLKKAAATHGSSELLSDCKQHQWHNHAFDNLTCKLHGCAIHVLQTLRWWSQEIEDVAWQWKVPTGTKGIQESWVEVLQLPTKQWWPQSHWDCVGRAKEAPCSKRVWRSENWEAHLQDNLQTESVTALDFIFHPRPRTTAFLFGETGERHAKKTGKMQVKQVWALWQIGGWPQYSHRNMTLCLHVHTDTCVCVYTQTHVSVCTHRHMCLCVHTDTCVCV